MPSTAPSLNRLLDSLSPAVRERLLALSKVVPLPTRTVLVVAGEIPKYAYFMTAGVTSVVIALPESGSTEVGLIGREGMIGSLQLLGPATSPAQSFIQVEGSALRVPFKDVQKLFREVEEFRGRVLEYVQQQTLTANQLTACNRLHETEARLARWLLMVQDRLQSDHLTLTQEFLAEMLGTQRTTVVTAAGALQRRGFITYSRGRITILSREHLEQAACDCYKVVGRLYRDLYRRR